MKSVAATIPKSSRAILVGGFICGILDITSAVILTLWYGQSPLQMLQGIASGLLGPDSYKGGIGTASLGLFLHFFIAFTAATVYHFASRKLSILIDKAVISGVCYGIAVYFFMYFIVLPLAFPHQITHPAGKLIRGLVIHVVCVGIPISLTNRWYSLGQRKRD